MSHRQILKEKLGTTCYRFIIYGLSRAIYNEWPTPIHFYIEKKKKRNIHGSVSIIVDLFLQGYIGLTTVYFSNLNETPKRNGSFERIRKKKNFKYQLSVPLCLLLIICMTVGNLYNVVLSSIGKKRGKFKQSMVFVGFEIFFFVQLKIILRIKFFFPKHWNWPFQSIQQSLNIFDWLLRGFHSRFKLAILVSIRFYAKKCVWFKKKKKNSRPFETEKLGHNYFSF